MTISGYFAFQSWASAGRGIHRTPRQPPASVRAERLLIMRVSRTGCLDRDYLEVTGCAYATRRLRRVVGRRGLQWRGANEDFQYNSICATRLAGKGT